MNQEYINVAVPDTSFAVPTEVVDRYLPVCTGPQLKVLLYLLRCGRQAHVEIKDAARACGLTVDEVRLAVSFWQGALLLRPLPEAGETKPQEPEKPQPAAPAPAAAPAPTPAPAAVEPRAEREPRPVYNPKQVSELLEGDPELRALYNHGQNVLGRIFTPTDSAILVSLHDWLGLPYDVILMILEHCASLDRRTMKYVERVAVRWADEGIDTFEKAEQFCKEYEANRSAEKHACHIMGIENRALSSSEKKHLTTWLQEWKFPPEMIGVAYQRCVDNTGKLSFPYMNSILSSWKAKGIAVPADLERDRPAAAENPVQVGGQSYDLDTFARLSMEVAQRERERNAEKVRKAEK